MSDMNPRRHQDRGGRGVAQWSVGERWETLREFAYRHNSTEWDLYTQLKFIWWELTEVKWFRDQAKIFAGGLDNFMKSKNIDEAVVQ